MLEAFLINLGETLLGEVLGFPAKLQETFYSLFGASDIAL